MMEGAYGGGKAGGVFDPISFVKRPQVILRALCWLFSVIIFGCISSEGWQKFPVSNKEECLYNKSSGACNFGILLAVVAFLASIGFIAGDFMFDQMSSVKTRKHYVLIDLGFSASWTFLYFIGFCDILNEWSKTDINDIPGGNGVNQAQATICFLFFSIISWGVLTFLAYKRYCQGAEQAFASSYDAEAGAQTGYSSYPDANDPDGGYSQPPFGTVQPTQPGVVQQPPPY